MATLGGKHVQASTGRELTYWCAYDIVGENEITYVAAISEGWNALGQHDATLRYDPDDLPAKATVRLDLLKHIDRTSFGQGQPADSKWIGWYGPYL